jgi:hypothetical protein
VLFLHFLGNAASARCSWQQQFSAAKGTDLICFKASIPGLRQPFYAADFNHEELAEAASLVRNRWLI